MRYLKAQSVLPQEVIATIQKYIDGEFIYIPRKDGEQRSWGEKSGTKLALEERNQQIYSEYLTGASIETLTKSFYLSEHSIRRIISKQRVC